MEAKSIYEALWSQGVQPEIVSFLSSLNWTFIIMFITILYGIKHTNHFYWYESFLEKIRATKYRVWVSALLTSLVFCFFRWKEAPDSFHSEYVSALLRSIFFSVVFSNIFVDIPVFLIKKLGNVIDKKEEPAPKRHIRNKR